MIMPVWSIRRNRSDHNILWTSPRTLHQILLLGTANSAQVKTPYARYHSLLWSANRTGSSSIDEALRTATVTTP